jgi:large subunit ribosomal protein L24
MAVTKFQKKFKIKKGDKVKIITGKDKGKEGEVLRVIKETDRLVVSGVNVAKKHTKPSMTSAGGIVEKELSIHISNVTILDPKSGERTKVGFKILKDGKKVRVARKSGETIA